MRLASLAKTALLLALSAALSAARDLPTSVVSEAQGYATADQAAVAALKIALPSSREFENGGFIIERDGAFYYSDPVSSGNTGHISFRAAVPPTSRMVAIYHTHPGAESESRLFSPDDVAEARQLGLDSYIGVLSDGSIRHFDPRRTPTEAYTPPGSTLRDGLVSEGVVVAQSQKY